MSVCCSICGKELSQSNVNIPKVHFICDDCFNQMHDDAISRAEAMATIAGMLYSRDDDAFEVGRSEGARDAFYAIDCAEPYL